MDRISRWRAKNPQKTAAYAAMRAALASGDVEKPDRCQDCRSRARLQGFHRDYARPLEVLWLCGWCRYRRRQIERGWPVGPPPRHHVKVSRQP